MNLNNMCCASALSLDIMYMRSKIDWDKRKIKFKTKLWTDKEDKYDNRPYALQLIIRSKKTDNCESYQITESNLQQMSGKDAAVFLMNKIKEMIKRVDPNCEVADFECMEE